MSWLKVSVKMEGRKKEGTVAMSATRWRFAAEALCVSMTVPCKR